MDTMHDRDGMEICYEIYYIKERAFKLLLAGLGQEMWYGLFSDLADNDSMGQAEETNELLADMYQNGIVDWDGAGVAVRQPYADMLAAMLDQKSCVIIQMSDPAYPLRCCYLSNAGIIMTQKSQREDAVLGMVPLSVQSWLRLLEELCVRMEDGEHCTLTRQNSEDGFVYQKAKIRRDGIRTLRMEWENNGGGILRCGQRELGEKIWEWLHRGLANT